ncbi:OPT oligopeptide transporter [Diaporthe helianthi]|uniref:OPT oligopeptide transporter n=1 Tax=Diaporthe helianthi TaxID=158607 RepID=A0A2P5HMD7_DIAHE|nr:OPT oligopeptide transporter [Diaporthe helianthi]
MTGLEKTMPNPEAVGVPIRDSIENPDKADILPREDVIVDLFSPLPPLEVGLAFGLTLVQRVASYYAIGIFIHGAGVIDIAPLTASAKASQLVFGGITSGQGLGIKSAQATNLVAGGIASGAADMSQSLVSDFRVSFLLKTPLNLQFWAQGFGTVVAMFLAPEAALA